MFGGFGGGAPPAHNPPNPAFFPSETQEPILFITLNKEYIDDKSRESH
jgi:hypothetical protein